MTPKNILQDKNLLDFLVLANGDERLIELKKLLMACGWTFVTVLGDG